MNKPNIDLPRPYKQRPYQPPHLLPVTRLSVRCSWLNRHERAGCDRLLLNCPILRKPQAVMVSFYLPYGQPQTPRCAGPDSSANEVRSYPHLLLRQWHLIKHLVFEC
jgi:hypothetical protein